MRWMFFVKKRGTNSVHHSELFPIKAAMKRVSPPSNTHSLPRVNPDCGPDVAQVVATLIAGETSLEQGRVGSGESGRGIQAGRRWQAGQSGSQAKTRAQEYHWSVCWARAV